MPPMTLTGISNRGLLLIALLVAILWGSILAERTIVSHAREQTESLLRSRRPTPAHYHLRPPVRHLPTAIS